MPALWKDGACGRELSLFDADEQGLRSCQFCGKKGHLADKCFSIPCRYCGISGHLSDSCFRKPQLKAQSNNALPINNPNGNAAKPQFYVYQGVGHIAKNCGNRFSNESDPGTFRPTFPRQNQGGQNSSYQPPNVSYAQATIGGPPSFTCRYCKTEGHLIRDCPTRFSPYVSNQGNDHGSPATDGQAAPRTNPTYMLTETEENKNQSN